MYLFLLTAMAISLAAPPAKAGKIQTGFLDRTVTLAGTEYKFQVFVPDNWTSKAWWPVILFLHGAGERGDDGLIETEVGIGTAIRRDRSRFPAIVVMPQCRKNVGGPTPAWRTLPWPRSDRRKKSFTPIHNAFILPA